MTTTKRGIAMIRSKRKLLRFRYAKSATRLLLAGATVLVLSATPASAQDSSDAWFAEFLEKALAAKPETFQFTNVRDITKSPATGAPGGAFLIRSKNGLTARMMLTDLLPGHALTFWWILFNAPKECAQSPCADTDLMSAGGAVHYASGAITGYNGSANVTFSTTSGGPPAGAIGNPALPERGLVMHNGFGVEVHLVVVDHGVPVAADFTSDDPDVSGTWGWELTHPLPPGPTWIRAAIFLPDEMMDADDDDNGDDGAMGHGGDDDDDGDD